MNYTTTDYDVFFGGFLFVLVLIGLVFAFIGYIITAIIYNNTAKANDLSELSFWAWIPIVNIYLLFAFSSNTNLIEETKKYALKFLLIYGVLIIISFIPLIGFLTTIVSVGLVMYFIYRLFYRWTGDSGTSVIFIILSMITCNLFFYIYGLMNMKKRFVA